MLYLFQKILIMLHLLFFSDSPSKSNVPQISKTPFHFEHSWILLRYHPKWWAHMESSKPKNKSHVINLGEGQKI
jgi:hypothetical protein